MAVTKAVEAMAMEAAVAAKAMVPAAEETVAVAMVTEGAEASAAAGT